MNDTPVETMNFRERVRKIIFDHNTLLSKGFDVLLLILILLAVFATMLESIESIRIDYGKTLRTVEWVFTMLFMLEYAARLYSVKSPFKYALSFYGIIDLLAWVPLWITLILNEDSAHYLAMIRILRVLRVFRILKLMNLVGDSNKLIRAMRESSGKIFVFLFFILTLVTVAGSIMYIIEGSKNDAFSSIPTSIYWAIITVTTVGFGDVYPITAIGKIITSVMVLVGYAIIAVPTGIVIGAMRNSSKQAASGHSCPECGRDGHHDYAIYCYHCGSKFPE